MCKFLTMFALLEPMAIGGELWFACEGSGVSTGGRAHSFPFFCSAADQGVQRVCVSDCHVNAGILARRTTDRDLEGVIPDKKEKKRMRGRSRMNDANL